MVQLAITKARTPTDLTVRITVDPYETTAPMRVAAMVWSASGEVLAAHAVDLVGVEADFLDTLVGVITQAWQWGAPEQQLAPAMKRVHKQAKAHRKMHER